MPGFGACVGTGTLARQPSPARRFLPVASEPVVLPLPSDPAGLRPATLRLRSGQARKSAVLHKPPQWPTNLYFWDCGIWEAWVFSKSFSSCTDWAGVDAFIRSRIGSRKRAWRTGRGSRSARAAEAGDGWGHGGPSGRAVGFRRLVYSTMVICRRLYSLGHFFGNGAGAREKRVERCSTGHWTDEGGCPHMVFFGAPKIQEDQGVESKSPLLAKDARNGAPIWHPTDFLAGVPRLDAVDADHW